MPERGSTATYAMTELDARLNAFRKDLADSRLMGKIEAPRFVSGELATVAVPALSVRRYPQETASVDTQFLLGDPVRIFDEAGGWSWIQGEHDHYCGYVESTGLDRPGPAATHRVIAPRSFVYPEPELRKPVQATLSMGSTLTVASFVENRGTIYAEIAQGGFVFAGHLVPVENFAADYVTEAEKLEGTPYLWGGASAFGIDCSGLVQLAMRMTGRNVLRDSDMQEASIGELLPPDAALRRGDLIFWKGHVAILLDEENLLHANGFTMQVSREPLSSALARIAGFYDKATSIRRP